MIFNKKVPPLKQRIAEMLLYINANTQYLENNQEALEIYEGALINRVLAILKSTLSEEYYSKIKDRVIPINFLPRIIDKMAQVYSKGPLRKCDEQDFVDDYVKWLDLNAEMSLADEYANLFKGYALEPFISSDGKPSIRSIPFNEFLVMSDDYIDKKNMTVFIKFMGCYQCETATGVYKNGVEVIEIKDVDWYISYTADEIVAFDAQGSELPEALGESDGVNQIKVIPFVYGNRSKQRLLPTQDTDIVQMIKMFPVFFSDLGGSIMFQCFSIIWGIDIDTSELKMSPNAYWDFKSDPTNENSKPEIGTLKPEADIEKVLTFISSIFTAWAESKSIRVNSIGKENAEAFASGISKAIDEMDTFMVRTKNIPFFRKEEKQLWKILALQNNQWIATKEIDQELYPSSIVDVPTVVKSFAIDFEPPKPVEDRNDVVDTQKKEYDNGFTTLKRAIGKINPDMGDTDVDSLIGEIDKANEDRDNKNTDDLDSNDSSDNDDENNKDDNEKQ